ncbi:uncharacterized protein NPIL_636231 [Nephila pilipes]|uniref:Uncharacterized protein n=1 Tax=Nephila pilipes TaxID=299642 RepID=A0A8X6Q407_NEPPI|nr:uncharacterized protein NPIL_636231 [Nephila pilipes]
MGMEEINVLKNFLRKEQISKLVRRRQLRNCAAMSSRNRRVLVLLLLFLICSQGFCSDSSPPETPHRQKRGIMKMMMHIMWDPVRLIRYWYAYDVTKEIAKSWRKILPTMMLLPFNPSLAETPGIAKYLHPTHGLGATKHHKGAKPFAYPAVSSAETYSASQFPKDYLIADPSLKDSFSQFQPGSGVVFEGPHKQVVSESSSNLDTAPGVFQQFLNSRPQQGPDGSRNIPISSFPMLAEGFGSNEEQQHVLLHPVPHGGGPLPILPHSQAASGEQMKLMPFPFKIDNPSKEHIIFKAMPISSAEIPDLSVEKHEGDNIPSSTNSNSKGIRNNYFKLPSEPPYSSYFHYQPDPSPQGSYEEGQKEGQAQTPHIIHTGRQELHIVLHPIPIGNTDPSSPATNAHALHFVPVNFNSSEEANNLFPIKFQTVSKASNQGESREKKNSVPPEYDEEFYPSNNNSGKTSKVYVRKDEGRYGSHEEDGNASSSSETSNSKQSSRITWILKESKSSRRKDTKTLDNDSESSIPRVSSVNFKDGDSQAKQPLRLNGQFIDLEQLREDLRHGTPVLIPFNRKEPFSTPTKSSDNSADIIQLDNYDGLAFSAMNMPKEFVAEKVSDEKTSSENNSAEQFESKNSTQRIIFFLRRPPPNNRNRN